MTRKQLKSLYNQGEDQENDLALSDTSSSTLSSKCGEDSMLFNNMWLLYNYLIEFTFENNKIIEPFLNLPSKRLYPDYYNEINRPISMNEIKENIQNFHYKSMIDLVLDFRLMFNNAMQFNVNESLIFQHSKILLDAMVLKYKEIEQESKKNKIIQGFSIDKSRKVIMKHKFKKKENSSTHASEILTEKKKSKKSKFYDNNFNLEESLVNEIDLKKLISEAGSEIRSNEKQKFNHSNILSFGETKTEPISMQLSSSLGQFDSTENGTIKHRETYINYIAKIKNIQHPGLLNKIYNPIKNFSFASNNNSENRPYEKKSKLIDFKPYSLNSLIERFKSDEAMKKLSALKYNLLLDAISIEKTLKNEEQYIENETLKVTESVSLE